MNGVCPNASFLHLPENMTHNDFELIEDLIVPFRDFITKIDEPIKHEEEMKQKKDGKVDPFAEGQNWEEAESSFINNQGAIS